MQGTCDNCSEVFNIKFKEKRHPKSIIETYFRCKHCKKKYTCFVTNPEVRKMQADIKKETNPFKRFGMQQEIKNKMKKLKEKITR